MKMKKATPAGALLRKDIFRFAPLWGGYFALVLVDLLYVIGKVKREYSKLFAYVELMNTLSIAGIVNAVYAALVAILLFGDLFSAKRCEALHAMPIRREKWFFCHLLHGLLYSLVPNFVAAISVMPTLPVGSYTVFIWLLGMTLQYLFFFGLAVLCVFLSGNSVGMLLLYSIFNLAGVAVRWFASTVFMPLLYGMPIVEGWVSWFSPVTKIPNMIGQTEAHISWYLIGRMLYVPGAPSQDPGFGPGWGYLALCAGISVVFMGIALLLYRKRKLECAGELLAQRWSKPVFAALFSLFLGAGFAAMGSLLPADIKWILLAAGVTVGWFGAQMLLHRSVKVFRGKVFLGFAVLTTCLVSSVALTAWDPAGITTYVPDSNNVERVEFGYGYSIDFSSKQEKYLDTTDKALIQVICDIHRQILIQENTGKSQVEGYVLRYTLKNGRQVERYYPVYADQEAWSTINTIFAGPEAVFGTESYEDWKNSVLQVKVDGMFIKDLLDAMADKPNSKSYDAEWLEWQLLLALWKDCKAGHISQQIFVGGEEPAVHQIHITMRPDPKNNNLTFSVTRRMKNCWAWIEKYADLFS